MSTINDDLLSTSINVLFNGKCEQLTIDQLVSNIYTEQIEINSLEINFVSLNSDPTNIKQQCILFIQVCMLLKLIRIHKDFELLHNRCTILIIDSAQCMYARYKFHRQLIQRYETPLIWLHPGVFAMWIGHNVEASLQPQHVEITTKAIKIQTDFLLFDLIDDKQQFFGIGKATKIQGFQPTNLCTSNLIEEYIGNTQSLFSITQIASLLQQFMQHFAIVKTTKRETVLSLIALLPIFPLQDMVEYGKSYINYNKAITDFYANGYVEANYIKYFHDNVLCVPFHFQYLIDAKANNCLPMIQLLIQQSHAFKICHQVLNFAYCEKFQPDFHFNNFVMFDGSKSGKTTFLVSLFFYYLFSEDQIPVIIQRNGNPAQNQRIQFLQNVAIGNELNQFNINYNSILEKFNHSNQSISYDQIYQLIVANVQDLLAYPTIMNTISDKIISSAHHVIIAKDQLKSIQNSEIKDKCKIIFLFNLFQESPLQSSFDIFWEIQNTKEKLHEQMRYYFVLIKTEKHNYEQSKYTIGRKIILLFDEVCYQKKNSHINCSKYNKLMQIAKFLVPLNVDITNSFKKFMQELTTIIQKQDTSSEAEQVVHDLFDQSQLLEDIGQKTTSGLSILDSSKNKSKLKGLNLTTIFLVCPLMLFMHKQQENELKCISQSDFWNLFIELQNTQGFEAIALRNIQSVISNKNELDSLNEFNNCFSKSLIIETLSRQIGQTNCASKENTYQQYELFEEKFAGIGNVISVYAGTNICMANFVASTKFVRPTLSSRDLQRETEMQSHTTILEKPQLQPNCTNFNYYQLGLDFGSNTTVNETISVKLNISTIEEIVETVILFGLDAAGQLQYKNSTVTPQLIVYNEVNDVVYQKSHQTLINITPNLRIVNKLNIKCYSQVTGIFKEQTVLYEKIVNNYVSLHNINLTSFKETNMQCIMRLKCSANQIKVQTLSYSNILIAATQINAQLYKILSLSSQFILQTLNVDNIIDENFITLQNLFEYLWLIHLVTQLANKNEESSMIHTLITKINEIQQTSKSAVQQGTTQTILELQGLDQVKIALKPFSKDCFITSIQAEFLIDDSLTHFIRTHIDIAILVAKGVFDQVSTKSRMVIVSVQVDSQKLQHLHKIRCESRENADNEIYMLQKQCVSDKLCTFNCGDKKPDFLIFIIINSLSKPEIPGFDYVFDSTSKLHIFHVVYEMGEHSTKQILEKCLQYKYIHFSSNFSNAEQKGNYQCVQRYVLKKESSADENEQDKKE